MLDEGLNEYWNARLLGERPASLRVLATLLTGGGAFPFGGFGGERFDMPREEPSDPLGANAYDRLDGIGPVYARTAVMLHDLEAQLGKDVMAAALREYYRRWKFRHPGSADLRETLAQVSGRRQLVETAFAQQVYAAQKVDDRIDAFTSEEITPQPGIGVTAAQRDAMEEQQRARTEAPFPFRTTVVLRRRGVPVPQTLVVAFADGSRETVQWHGTEQWRRFEWIKPARAVSARLDPERRHLLDVNKLDDTRTLAPDPAAARRWTFDAAAIAQTLLALVATL